MFTIEPGSEAGVSANVADLVVAAVADDGVLRFSWNSQVASGAFSGGVKVTMPADSKSQRRRISSVQWLCCILNGTIGR